MSACSLDRIVYFSSHTLSQVSNDLEEGNDMIYDSTCICLFHQNVEITYPINVEVQKIYW